MSKIPCLSMLMIIGGLAQVSAQSEGLPAYAYDAFADISMATTAAAQCDGTKLNDRKQQSAMVDLMRKLIADGFDAVQSVKHLETDAGQAEISQRFAALRERHGVAAQGTGALCAAIRLELESNRSLAKMLKMR